MSRVSLNPNVSQGRESRLDQLLVEVKDYKSTGIPPTAEEIASANERNLLEKANAKRSAVGDDIGGDGP